MLQKFYKKYIRIFIWVILLTLEIMQNASCACINPDRNNLSNWHRNYTRTVRALFMKTCKLFSYTKVAKFYHWKYLMIFSHWPILRIGPLINNFDVKLLNVDLTSLSLSFLGKIRSALNSKWIKTRVQKML